MGLDLKCPRCGKMMTFKVSSARVECRHCGYAPIDDANRKYVDEPPARQIPVDLANVRPISRHKPSPRQESLFYEGMLALKRGDRKAAQRYFKSSLELDKAFTDPWFWLASTTDNPAEQRQYLEWVLAHEPDHIEALKALALLDGRLKESDFNPKSTQFSGVTSVKELRAEAEKMQCPQCGGRLTYDIARRKVVCWNCNYQKDIEERAYGEAGGMLVEALLKRKYKKQHWEGTERILTCDNCGATVTLSARTMTDRCAFCGSTRVLVADNKKTFEQPDGIVPFRGKEEHAIKAVQDAMNKGLRGLMRFFRDDISYEEAHPVYIAFWLFEATATVKWSYPGSPFNGEDAFMLSDIVVSATDTLDKRLLKQILPYEMRYLQKYDPRFLSDWPAEIYHLDVDEASLNAREEMSRQAKLRTEVSKDRSKRYSQGVSGSRQERTVELHVSPPHISGMTYRLVLLPVWVVLLHEGDGDVRRCLVNGQTGKVAVEGKLGGLL
ncbi:MAG: hypothetical protein JXB47_05505 [Anaerolineae bacterium]|nr:hypothetical protein [Anaerolineae bacterium]